MEKNKKFYLIANKKTGKFYKTNACIRHGEFAVKLTSVGLEEATIFKKKEEAQRIFNYVEDKRIFKQWLERTITVAEIQYEVSYLI
jgi:hypothetical protein